LKANAYLKMDENTDSAPPPVQEEAQAVSEQVEAQEETSVSEQVENSAISELEDTEEVANDLVPAVEAKETEIDSAPEIESALEATTEETAIESNKEAESAPESADENTTESNVEVAAEEKASERESGVDDSAVDENSPKSYEAALEGPPVEEIEDVNAEYIEEPIVEASEETAPLGEPIVKAPDELEAVEVLKSVEIDEPSHTPSIRNSVKAKEIPQQPQATSESPEPASESPEPEAEASAIIADTLDSTAPDIQLYQRKYIGGYKNKNSGVEYYHCTTQTITPHELKALVCPFIIFNHA
jgi:hypothetical protein